jgi:hypothetical protein
MLCRLCNVGACAVCLALFGASLLHFACSVAASPLAVRLVSLAVAVSTWVLGLLVYACS